MIESNDIALHMSKGIDYLLAMQDTAGSWRDYQLPVGESDQWVTAFTALGVLRAGRVLNNKSALKAAEMAANFLLKSRCYEAGWGYNSNTGVDADSTAYAIQLFRALGRAVPKTDEACLMENFCDKGGVSTYLTDSGWGIAHPDVTAAVGLALNDTQLLQKKQVLRKYCEESFISGIGWPTYWWKNHLYATWHMLELYQRLELTAPTSVTSIGVSIESAFDLAWAVGILNAMKCPESIMDKPLSLLCQLQLPSGKWLGANNLRVTDPTCLTPWVTPMGEYYIDNHGTITTAAALTVLSKMIPLWWTHPSRQKSV